MLNPFNFQFIDTKLSQLGYCFGFLIAVAILIPPKKGEPKVGKFPYNKLHNTNEIQNRQYRECLNSN